MSLNKCLALVLLGTVLVLILSGKSETEAVEKPENWDWESYKKFFKKTYKDGPEEEKSKQAFEESLKRVEDHNKKFAKGEVTFSMGINQFSDGTRPPTGLYLSKR